MKWAPWEIIVAIAVIYLLLAGCATDSDNTPVRHDTQGASMYANCVALIAETESPARTRAFRATFTEMAAKHGITLTSDDIKAAGARVDAFAKDHIALGYRAQYDCFQRAQAYNAGIELIIPEVPELSNQR